MANLFCKAIQAQNYAAARPTYPPEFFRFIASKTSGRRLAWDVGTGSGQAAVSLSSLFDSVVATDVSKEQLAQAPANIPNIRFIHTPPSLPLADLHRLVAPPGSVDLITVAQALHWFDLKSFYDQVRAMLRPSGVVAAWCYSGAIIDSVESRTHGVYRRVYAASGPFWAKERRMVEEGYQGLEFPFRAVDGEESTGPLLDFAAEREMAAEDFLEYVRSWSAYQTAIEKGVELLTEEVVEEFERAWSEDGKEKKKVRFPISLWIGRV